MTSEIFTNDQTMLGNTRTARLFISHAWDYDQDYRGVINLLRLDTTFKWEDLSIPFDNPIQPSIAFPKSNGKIVDELRNKISQADCLLVIGAMYCHHRAWIQTEIEAAKQYNKPILAIKPNGQERLPAVIHEADQIVGWRSDSIIRAIRKLTGLEAITSMGQCHLSTIQSFLDNSLRQQVLDQSLAHFAQEQLRSTSATQPCVLHQPAAYSLSDLLKTLVPPPPKT